MSAWVDFDPKIRRSGVRNVVLRSRKGERLIELSGPNEPGARAKSCAMLARVKDQDVPFAAERYISLETFKRDGGGVKTPVWAAPLDGALVVFSAGDSFKVKRLR